MSQPGRSRRIWTSPMTLEAINAAAAGSIHGPLGISITEIGDDYLRGSMPVDARTRQPGGLLHGGASVVLAESLGSLGAAMCIDRDRQRCVGIEINANHLRAVREGMVVGTARPIHRGRSTQVWEIRIEDQQQRLTCIARLTTATVAA